MKNIELKRKLSSLLPSPTGVVSNQIDLHKVALEAEITNVEKQLITEYNSVSRVNTRESDSNFEEERTLKNTLNKLLSENKAKEAKILGLKDLISCYAATSPKNTLAISSINTIIPEEEEADNLRDQLSSEAAKISEEESNTEVLIETKNKIINSSLIWKERLVSLTKMHKEIERKYNEVIDTKQQAAYSLLSVQADLSKLRKYMEENQRKFQNAVEKGKIIKEAHEHEVKEKIEKISRVNLKSRVIFT